MKLYRYRKPGWRHATIGLGQPAGLIDLASLDGFRAVEAWAAVIAMPDLADRLAAALATVAEPRIDVPWSALAPGPDPDRPHLLSPLDRQEVWGAGVTYAISRLERMRESEASADCYDRVYSAARPELFFKATPERVEPPGGRIRVRPDSRWTVPEPEVAVVARPDLSIVGWTLGNDVSARDIEGENPLYLPQAKVYRGSCSVGPALRLADGAFDPRAEQLSCQIERHGAVIWHDATSVDRLKRGWAELLGYLGQELDFPHGVVLLTGTCLVPPAELSLQPGDRVTMSLTGVGELVNVVG